ncbi:MAG: hypothetical protein QG635_2275 [Bacteroidota bacterium]|nr:hypothetical protein [Bacteroidota bacterium]
MKRLFYLLIALVGGAILAQGFQCASRDLTTAQLAYQNNDAGKAKMYIFKELSMNPENAEAMFLLYQVYTSEQNLDSATYFLKKAEVSSKDPKLTDKIKITIYKAWVDNFNNSLKYYNLYFSGKEKRYLDSSLKFIDAAVVLRPEMENFYMVRGYIFSEMGDTNRSIEAYSDYAKYTQKELDFAEKYNVYLDEPRAEVLHKFGKPESTTIVWQEQVKDSIASDIFKIEEKEVFIFSTKKENEKFLLKAWRVDPPKTWNEVERSQFSGSGISLGPFLNLTQIYYNRKDYDNALKYIKKITYLEPTNTDANSFLVQIYSEQGKMNEAINYIKGLTEKQPDNKFYWSQYGDMLLSQKKYDEALRNYEKAIQIDPEFYLSYRNAASAFKNKSMILQDEEFAKLEKDPKYKVNPEVYLPALRKSAEYFEKSRNSDQFREDLEIMAQLANIYEVTNEKQKLDNIIKELEGLEYTVENLENYYRIMCQLYQRLKMADKEVAACKKYEENLKK